MVEQARHTSAFALGGHHVPARIDVIDGLRGLAALAVCIFHAGLQLPGEGLQQVTRFGYVGIHVFFNGQDTGHSLFKDEIDLLGYRFPDA